MNISTACMPMATLPCYTIPAIVTQVLVHCRGGLCSHALAHALASFISSICLSIASCTCACICSYTCSCPWSQTCLRSVHALAHTFAGLLPPCTYSGIDSMNLLMTLLMQMPMQLAEVLWITCIDVKHRLAFPSCHSDFGEMAFPSSGKGLSR